MRQIHPPAPDIGAREIHPIIPPLGERQIHPTPPPIDHRLIFPEPDPALIREVLGTPAAPDHGIRNTSDATGTGPDGGEIRHRDIEHVPARGRIRHVLDGNINGLGRASGGHYVRSPNLRILTVQAVDRNGVIRARIAVRSHDGRWIAKRDESTLFPPHWTRRRVAQEIDLAYRHSHPIPHRRRPNLPSKEWIGRSSDGLTIKGRYLRPGDPTHGWSTAYPVQDARS